MGKIQEIHDKKIKKLSEQLKILNQERKDQNNPTPISLKYFSDNSLTIRTKSYKNSRNILNFNDLNNIIKIDADRQIAIVEPRVTMDQLVKAAQQYGLIVPVIPEIKKITVGGAIMGVAGESSSHQWGCFADFCHAFEILCGDGRILKVTPSEHPEIFYGISGSYGSLGTLTSAEIKLIPGKEFVMLRYHVFSDPGEALKTLCDFSHDLATPDFVEGFVFSKNFCVIAEGNLKNKDEVRKDLPNVNLEGNGEFFYEHVYNHAKAASHSSYEEIIPYYDYVFRHDYGAFWMGAYFLKFPMLARLMGQGIFKRAKPVQDWFSQDEINRFGNISNQNVFLRTLFKSCLKSKRLSQILHMAENWFQNRFVVQDFCIPETNAMKFLEEVLIDPGIFPIWLCPLKATNTPQIFAPHYINDKNQCDFFIDFGLYGLPAYSVPLEYITKKMEQKTLELKGKKVLYSRSYYNLKEFWEIYSKAAYESLREEMHAKGVWHEVTEKVLSI